MAHIPSDTHSIPTTITPTTSLIDAPLSTGDVPLMEPLYSTVVPRSQRHNPPIQPSSSILTPSQSTRTSPTIPQLDSANIKTTNTGGDGSSTTNLRVRYLEQMIARLDREKKGMEEEFGRQRKKFMREMLQAESETNLAKDSISRHIKEIERLNMRLMKEESINKMAANEDKDGERVQLINEVDTLKIKLQEFAHEQSVKTEQLKNEWLLEKKSLEAQLIQWKQEYKNLSQQSKKSTEHRKGTKSPRDRSKSPTRGRQTGTRSPEGAISLIVPGGGSQEDQTFLLSSLTPAVNFSSESSLQSSMIEAAKESQLLRAVVVPLEEEIDMLKVQLREAQERHEIYEDNPGIVDGSKLSSISPIPKVAIQSEDVSEKELLEKLLNQEREARHDLEMHADGLRRHKTILLSDIEQLKQQLQDIRSELKTEQVSHSQLQRTWEQANLKFVESQDVLRNQLLKLQKKTKQDIITNEDEGEQIVGVVTGIPLSHDLSDNQHRISSNRNRSLSLSTLSDIERVNGQENESSWKLIVDQLQRSIVGLRRDLDIKGVIVEEYKHQLERVQGQLMQELDEKDDEIIRIKADHDKIKAALFRERKQREDLRRQLVSEKETMKLRIEQFQSHESKLKHKLKNIKDKFTEMKHETQKEMTQFTDDRVRLHGLLEQKNEEYSCLKEVHTSEVTEHQQNVRKLKQLQQEAELNVASTMEELTRVRDTERQTVAGLKTEIAAVKQQLILSNQDKAGLKDQLGVLQTDLIEIQRVNNKLEKDCHNLKSSRNTIQEKSKSFIEEQQQQITQLTEDKTRLDTVQSNLHKQLIQLKQQLVTSEANQKDFVRLSQTLQVRLAEMEEGGTSEDHQSNNEVTTVIDNNNDLFS